MIVILDYKVGNLDSIQRGFSRVGLDTIITNDKELIEQAEMLILPGVGAFGDAMKDLVESGLVPLIKRFVKSGKPLVGICLGMQLLFDESDEFGTHQGLGLIPGRVTKLEIEYKIPHMGWNDLAIVQNDPVMKYINTGDYVYFVHSYYADMKNDYVVASTTYGVEIPAIVRKDNVIGMQFHPEKSGRIGLRLLQAVKELVQ